MDIGNIASLLFSAVLFLVIIVAPIVFVLYFIYRTIKNPKDGSKLLIHVIPWALIIGVIVLALLYVPHYAEPYDVCTMPGGMTCSRFNLSPETDLLNVTLVNGLQKTIDITNVSCSKDLNQFEQCDAFRCSDFSGDGVTVRLGSAFKALVTCNDESGKPMSFEPGDSYNGKINVEYYFLDEGPSAKRKLSGNVYARVA